ncbi:hypothetical protein JB92DRAFT_2060797 [Gautieria morchelliformis]|nr:hypothetical protein JB92DRAFT_2060797 [Gautieria morchelliformis]
MRLRGNANMSLSAVGIVLAHRIRSPRHIYMKKPIFTATFLVLGLLSDIRTKVHFPYRALTPVTTALALSRRHPRCPTMMDWRTNMRWSMSENVIGMLLVQNGDSTYNTMLILELIITMTLVPQCHQVKSNNSSIFVPALVLPPPKQKMVILIISLTSVLSIILLVLCPVTVTAVRDLNLRFPFIRCRMKTSKSSMSITGIPRVEDGSNNTIITTRRRHQACTRPQLPIRKPPCHLHSRLPHHDPECTSSKAELSTSSTHRWYSRNARDSS